MFKYLLLLIFKEIYELIRKVVQPCEVALFMNNATDNKFDFVDIYELQVNEFPLNQSKMFN